MICFGERALGRKLPEAENRAVPFQTSASLPKTRIPDPHTFPVVLASGLGSVGAASNLLEAVIISELEHLGVEHPRSSKLRLGVYGPR